MLSNGEESYDDVETCLLCLLESCSSCLPESCFSCLPETEMYFPYLPCACQQTLFQMKRPPPPWHFFRVRQQLPLPPWHFFRVRQLLPLPPWPWLSVEQPLPCCGVAVLCCGLAVLVHCQAQLWHCHGVGDFLHLYTQPVLGLLCAQVVGWC